MSARGKEISMKISGLIRELEELQRLRGDIDVFAYPTPEPCGCGAESLPAHEIMDVPEVVDMKHPGQYCGATIAVVRA